MDLYVDTAFEADLQPGETYHLPTGIRVEIPRNFFGAIYPQFNLHKKGLTLADTVGIINSSDRGEIVLVVKNIFSDVIRINGQWGLRTPIAQLIIQPYRFEKVEVAEGGFGRQIISEPPEDE
jgi:dUTP pyrophosphatase